MKLSKSLAELDAVATELLSKSVKEEDTELTPDEISEDSVKTDDETTEESNENKNEDKDKDEDTNTDTEEKDMEKSEDTEDIEEDMEKSEDVEETEEEEEEEEEIPEGDTEEDVNMEDVEKSMKDKFQADSTISKAVKDSEFFSAVVEVLAKSMSDVQYDILSKSKTTEQSTEVLAKSLRAALTVNDTLVADNKRLSKHVRSLEKSVSEGFEKISEGFEKISDMLDDISSQPVGMRKSVSSISVHDRDFEQSINGTRNSTFDSLSKSQVLSILNNELYTGNQNVTASDIISYESGAPLRQDLQTLVENKCR